MTEGIIMNLFEKEALIKQKEVELENASPEEDYCVGQSKLSLILRLPAASAQKMLC